MGHSGDPDKFLEIFGNELRPVVGNYPWAGSRVFLFGALQNDLNVWFGHLLSDLPMDDGTATAIQEAAQVVEGATDVEIRDIDVPMLMRSAGLLKALPFGRGPMAL